MNVDHSCGTPHAIEDEGDTLALGKQRKFTSKVCKHYDYKVISGYQRLFENIVGKKLSSASRNGTEHLKDISYNLPYEKNRNILPKRS